MKAYDDIINLPHHVSATRPQMSIANRAAQFSPFAALTGYDAAIAETARLTDERKELSEDMLEAISMKLGMLEDATPDRPEVSVTYFQKDEKKAGGAYITATGAVKKIDDYEGVIVLVNGKKINIRDILDIEGKLFKSLL